MQYLKVKNWDNFQQYKDRDPKWIKLHRGLLRDYEFGSLPDNQKACLLMIWLLAAETDNKIPNDVDWIQRQAQLKSKPDIKQLVTIGFLSVYDSVQDCTEVYIETETYSKETYSKETETEAREKFEILWKIYPRRDGSKSKAFEGYKSALKTGVEHGRIESGVRAYADSVRGKDQKYTAHFTTWLNGKRWESDYTPSATIIEQPAKSKWLSAADEYIAKHSQPAG